MSDPLLPSIEKLVVAFLKADAGVDALVHGRVGTTIPANATWPRIKLHQSGGAWTVREWLTGARVQIEAWGEMSGYTAAEEIARTVEARLGLMEGKQAGGEVVTNVDQTLGIQDFPDPDTGRPRFLQEFIVQAHP